MKDRPILFSSEMVRALLDGRKTQTRRVVKPEHIRKHGACKICNAWRLLCGHAPKLNSPYGQPGDLLWVRETWADVPYECRDDGMIYERIATLYCADGKGISEYGPDEIKWKPSIHMRKVYSRLTLRITDVRVERVQDISEQDAKTEGADARSDLAWGAGDGIDMPGDAVGHAYRAGFQGLWDSINAGRGYGWDVNPWVWVVKFEVIHENVDTVLREMGIAA